MTGDGCTYWFDGDWRECCDAHDVAYATDTVTMQTHFDLGACVVASGGGVLMGVVMALATLIWWIVKHRMRR